MCMTGLFQDEGIGFIPQTDIFLVLLFCQTASGCCFPPPCCINVTTGVNICLFLTFNFAYNDLPSQNFNKSSTQFKACWCSLKLGFVIYGNQARDSSWFHLVALPHLDSTCLILVFLSYLTMCAVVDNDRRATFTGGMSTIVLASHHLSGHANLSLTRTVETPVLWNDPTVQKHHNRVGLSLEELQRSNVYSENLNLKPGIHHKYRSLHAKASRESGK